VALRMEAVVVVVVVVSAEAALPRFMAAVAAGSEAVARPFTVEAAGSELQPRRSMAAAFAQADRPLSAAVFATAPPFMAAASVMAGR
jgi:hypothetical protein